MSGGSKRASGCMRGRKGMKGLRECGARESETGNETIIIQRIYVTRLYYEYLNFSPRYFS